ncbi:MAG: acetate/propionate family kinase [Proteobacteria bacterium]|jgi:acetate kinase|nr:acetate/propionate family kinase [Pseudomonadota bacterium]
MKSILVLNAGSSSLKFAVFPLEPTLAEHPALSGQIEGIGATPKLSAKTSDGKRFKEDVALKGDLTEQHQESLSYLFRWLETNAPELKISAAGHRVVHGGEGYSAPVKLDAAILAKLETLIPLAPLHQPHNLRAVSSIFKLLPNVPQVACFDTAFHRHNPEVAQIYGLPRALTQGGIKSYGFHGLSYDYITRTLPEVIGEKAKGAIVIAHLGNGASMAAVRDGTGVATTMGFSTINGLLMGTRCGSIDPGVLLYLIDQKGMDYKALTQLLYKDSGLLGVSGFSQDMRDLLASDAPEAREAVDLFCYRIARELGSLAAAAGGLDALVFTGGIGEHAAAIRERVCALSAWLGIDIDPAANGEDKLRIDSPKSRVAVAVVPTNEEGMIARYTAEVLKL